MKLTVKLTDLQQIVNLTSVVSPTRTTLPSLNAVLLAYHDCELTARTSDLANTAIARCAAIGEESRAFGVSAARLGDYLQCCIAEEVEIEVAERASFRCGNERTTLAVTKAEEFPKVVEVEGQTITVTANELHGALSRVIHAAHTDDVNSAALCSVAFDFTDTDLSLVAFCGKGVACSKLPIGGKGIFLVPSRFVGYALKIIDGSEEEMRLTFAENAVRFSGESWSLTGSLVNGQYPNWRQAESWLNNMPKMTFKRDELERALKGSLPFGEAGFTRMAIGGTNGVAAIHVEGQNERTSEIAMSGRAFKFTIDGRRLLPLIAVLKNDDVVLEYDGTQGRGVMIQEQNFFGGVMPLNK